jgi:ABC-type sugar transport system permease subunit
VDRVVITAVGIVATVGLSALVFVGANKLFDLTETRFPIFNASIGAVAGFVVFGLLWANRITISPVIVTVIAVVLGAATGYALGLFEGGSRRLVAGLIGGLALGLLLGFTVRSFFWPSIDPVAAVIGLAVGGGLGYLNWLAVRNRYNLRPLLFLWLGIGWLFGAWLTTDFDATLSGGSLSGSTVGTQAEAIIVAAVLGLLVGAWIGTVPYPDKIKRADISLGSRKFIFLAPALGFIIATLLIPLGRTIWLGFLSGSPTDLQWTGLTNYADIFTDPGIINFSDWTSMFSSTLFWGGVLLVVGGFALGAWIGRSGGTGLGTGFSLSAGTLSMLAGGAALLGFAVFVAIRGTISNNLWWIFSVIIFAVGLGLAVAVLADRSKGENIAKSLIFLPMAISFVGASVIWRLMYIARPPGDQQTGVFNTLWVQIGEWSNSATASTVISGMLGLIVLGLAYLAFRGWQSGSNALAAGSLVLTLPLLWLIYRFLGPGIGGFVINSAGEVVADPVLFIQNAPWNNFWMMVVFIWIQTGFAMVIFSAAIKAVPEDLLEAARIDGATESQTFWRVTVPQIFPTIGVVVTTLIVTVLKVFDIPKVMTNGNFDTQVLANEMWQKAFTELDFGTGSALAALLFVAVLPVMYINIRRMQKERLG